MEEKTELKIGESVEHLSAEQLKQLRQSFNPDEMGFNGREGEEK